MITTVFQILKSTSIIAQKKKVGEWEKLFKSSFSLFNVKHIYIINKVIMLSPQQQLKQKVKKKSLINK